MFFFLSKFLGFLILPQGILLTLSILIYKYRKNHTKVKKLAIFSICLTYLFCNTLFVNTLASLWEVNEVSVNTISKHDYAVLLTGGLINEYGTNIQLGISGDRLWKALLLFQQKKIDRLVITGGDINPKTESENSLAKKFLIQNGIPASAIIQETKAVNTHENALFTAKLVEKNELGKNGLLISSAYHLKRAQACFVKQGLLYDLFPTGNIYQKAPYDIYSLLPQAENFKKSELLIKEIAGYLIYKIKGYL